MDNLKKLEFVKYQLASYSGQKRLVGDTTFILCPYHQEKTPSGRIFHSPRTRSPGYFTCYGCGTKKSWDELAPAIGLNPFQWTKPKPVYAHSVLSEAAEKALELKFEFDSLPPNKVWRQISTNLLIDVGCKIISQYGTRFIYMPVRIRNEERGYIRARLRKVADKPSYLNKAGKWSEQHGLFPYDYAVKTKPQTIVLVEGPRDALRLLSNGIPAIAILGTQSWSETKSRNLELSGAKNIVLMMDGDDAGIKATSMLAPSLSKMFRVHEFELSGDDSPYFKYKDNDAPSKAAKLDGVSLWDPGNCPPHKITELKKLIRKLNGS